MINKISPSQKKIIIIAILVILAFLGFWIFIYFPAKTSVNRLKAEIVNLESQIQEIDTLTDKSNSIAEGIRSLEGKFCQLENRLSQKEQEGLRMLSDLARKFGLEVVSIRPQLKNALLDRGNQKMEIEGKACQSVLVTIEIRCTYRDLVRYLENLTRSTIMLTGVERLKINKDASGSAVLNVTLDLNLYLLF